MDIDEVCSIGFYCYSSKLLEDMKIRTCSYPFDWIFSNTKLIKDCLEDNFKRFMDKSYYISGGRGKCVHTLYGDHMTFFHKNPLDSEEDYKYYIRCIDRFNKLLKNKNNKKLFVITLNFGKEENKKKIWIDKEKQQREIIELNNFLSKYTSNYRILCIYIIKDNTQKYEFTEINNIDFLKIHTKSTNTGKVFRDEKDNEFVHSILNKKYNFYIEQD